MGKVIIVGHTATSLLGFRRDMINEMIRLGYVAYVFTSEYSVDDLEHLKILGCIPVTYHMSRGGLNPLADLKTIFELKTKIKEIQPLLVFSYFTKPVIYGSLAAKLSRTPKVIGMIEGLGTPFTIHKNGQSLKVKLIRFIQICLYRIVFPFRQIHITISTNNYI